MAQVNVPDPKAAVNGVVGYIQWAAGIIVDLGLMLILAGAVLKAYRFSIPFIPSMGANEMFWLMAAYAAYRFKGKLV